MDDLGQRSAALELMDTETVSFAEFDACLRHIAAINRVSLAYRPTLRWLDTLVADRPEGASLTILDVGSGQGDMLRRVADWAARRGVGVRLLGVDLNPWSERAARAVTPPDLPIRFETCDVFAWEPGERVDAVISSLFTHHLGDDDLIAFLRWMTGVASEGWFINDLHRHALPYHTVRLAARMLPVNRMVKHDAPLSVARAFTRADWLRTISRAGLDADAISVTWWFPFRFGVGWRR